MRGIGSVMGVFRWFGLAGLLAVAPPLVAQSTAFTYQGQLEVAGSQASSYDFQADVFPQACSVEPCSGTPLNAAPLLFPGVVLRDGRFLLVIDPGADVFTGPERFLQLRVRRAGTGSFTTLLPRQKISAAPYAQHAADADFAAQVAPGSVGTGELATGAVGTSNLANGAVTAAKVDATQIQRRISGTCAAGSAMRAVDQSGAVLTCEPTGANNSWSTQGNTPASGQFLGTLNTQPLELRSSNQRVADFSVVDNAVNVLLGYKSNQISAGARGATIGGGGFSLGINRVTDSFGTVGGGNENQAGDDAGAPGDASGATVSGGQRNVASAPGSTVSGGTENTASVQYSSIGGGVSNFAGGEGSSVAGGLSNRALGSHSTVIGGHNNIAFADRSVVSGGAFNCAGGRHSWAGGLAAKVRLPSGTGADPVGSACDGVENAADIQGDRGTFVWADAQGDSFVSNGPHRFLVRAQGGMTLQQTGTQARSHRGYLNVVKGDSGLPLASTTLSSSAVAVFENDDGADMFLIAGGTRNKGLRFGDALDAFTGGILYTPGHSMLFRADGNVTRMTLSPNGTLTLTGGLLVPLLGSGGSTQLCRNSLNQVATCSSSARYKQAITALGLGLDAVLRLRPVGYEWRESGMPDVGFVAEEVAKIDERLVTRNDEGLVEGVRYERLTAVLAGAVQELAAKEDLARETSDALRAEVDALRSEVARLHTLLERKEH